MKRAGRRRNAHQPPRSPESRRSVGPEGSIDAPARFREVSWSDARRYAAFRFANSERHHPPDPPDFWSATVLEHRLGLQRDPAQRARTVMVLDWLYSGLATGRIVNRAGQVGIRWRGVEEIRDVVRLG